MAQAPELLARGPWTRDAVRTRWREDRYALPPAVDREADAIVRGLRDRGSPSHDGEAARLASHGIGDDGALEVELQPVRWSARLVRGHESRSISGLCLVRDASGRWLAGRRAAWVATWAGEWALGAGGAVDPGEGPMRTLERELWEEWAVEPTELQGEALVLLPGGSVMFVGQARIPDGAELTMDPEHDAHAWWPADVDAWPAEASAPLRLMVRALELG